MISTAAFYLFLEWGKFEKLEATETVRSLLNRYIDEGRFIKGWSTSCSNGIADGVVNFDDVEAQGYFLQVLFRVFKTCDLPPGQMYSWWRKAGYRRIVGDLDFSQDLKRLVFGDNLTALVLLEGRWPGITKGLLDEFGVRNFGRYPIDVLIRMYKEREKGGPYMVAFYPKDDYSGILMDGNGWMRDLYEDLSLIGWPLRIYEVDTPAAVVGRYRALYEKNGQRPCVGIALYCGHGSEEGITFDRRRFGLFFNGRSLEEMKRYFIFDSKKGLPVIVLNSCYAGKRGRGVGWRIHQAAGVRVISFEGRSKLCGLSVREDDNSKIKVETFWGKDEGSIVYG
jgi:hypothetical protein